ncbi:MAG: hypothetical protein V7677_10345 [Motiliproteus sp.]
MSDTVKGLLVGKYPAGISAKWLRENLTKQGVGKSQITNGLYGLTSRNIAEAVDGQYFLVSDPKAPVAIAGREVIAPRSSPAAVVLKPVTVTPKLAPENVTVTTTPTAKTVAVKEPEETPMYDKTTVEKPEASPVDPALQAISELSARLAKADRMTPVERADHKVKVLVELSKLFYDDRLDKVLNEICDDLTANAA